MKSLASAMFFENFQIPSELTPVAEWIPPGPPGLLWWLISSAIGSFFSTAATYGLIGLWIQDPLPETRKRFLEALSHDSTSGSMASRYSSLYHSTTWAALSLLIAGVLPSVSSTLPPLHHSTDQNVMLASVQWLMAMPTGLPCFLRIFPALSRSSQVFGGCSPAFLNCASL